MAIGTIAAIAGGIGAVSSAASALGKQDPKFNLNTQNFGVDRSRIDSSYNGLLSAVNDTSGYDATRDYANLLQQYQGTGGVPTNQDINSANQYGASQFGAQRTQLAQSFQDQITQANNQAALSGRGVNDPILRAKLAQEQTRQQQMLASQQGAFSSQYANQISNNRLTYASGRANALTSAQQQRVSSNSALYNAALGAGQQNYQQQMGIAGGNYQEQQAATSGGQRASSIIQGTLGSFGAGLQIQSALSGPQMQNSFNPNYTFGQTALPSTAQTYSLGNYNY